jgi:hypothetical protein
MKTTLQLALVLLLVALGMVACGGGHHDGGQDETNFTGFVSNLAASPSETDEPIPINDANFTFSEDPHAFDALFQ